MDRKPDETAGEADGIATIGCVDAPMSFCESLNGLDLIPLETGTESRLESIRQASYMLATFRSILLITTDCSDKLQKRNNSENVLKDKGNYNYVQQIWDERIEIKIKEIDIESHSY